MMCQHNLMQFTGKKLWALRRVVSGSSVFFFVTFSGNSVSLIWYLCKLPSSFRVETALGVSSWRG
jgi:hypothetical protein